jgi:hypothetical protein
MTSLPEARFRLVADYEMTGDQPQAVEKLIRGLEAKQKHQTLLGVTGSGKTFNMANVIAHANRPTIVISPNKTLAAQLYSEFRDFFPDNAVEYFVSYYDYYQPTSRAPTPTSPRTPISTRRSTSCGTPPPAPSSSTATSSLSLQSPASTVSASPPSTTASSCASRRGTTRTAAAPCASSSTCSPSATTRA